MEMQQNPLGPGAAPSPVAARSSAAEVARRLGISTAAVSYALNGRPGVSAVTRERVLAAAAELGLAIPTLAVQERRPVLGLVLANVRNPFYSELAVSVTDAARADGYEVFLSSTQDDQEKIEASVAALIAHGVDAVLLTAMSSSDATVVRQLRAAKVPIVLVSRRLQGVQADFVGMDDRLAGREMGEHVLGHGFTDIAVVAGPATSTASSNRAEGFLTAFRAAGLPIRRDWLIRGGLNESDGAKAADYLLGHELPRCVLCGTDAIALGLITVLTRHGVRVPEDVAVTGFDGLTSASSALVGLTTVIQPRHEMAAEAIRLVTQRRADPNRDHETVPCPHRPARKSSTTRPGFRRSPPPDLSRGRSSRPGPAGGDRTCPGDERPPLASCRVLCRP